MGFSTTQFAGTQTAGSEQRVSVRKRISQPFPIELLPGKEAWLHDLSEGGLSVTGGSGLELGTNTYLRFQFPETNSLIDAIGVVAWSDLSGRAGVRFTRVDENSTAAVRQWLAAESIPTADSPSEAHPRDVDFEGQIAYVREISDLQTALLSQPVDRASALDLIVHRMLDLTRASGAAIALREGEDVVCRARAGNAPDIGVKLSASSLSGECLRTATIVMLNDSESDARVNPDLCRELNFRSLLVLPVRSGMDVIGIAEVLSPNPRNFEGGDVLVLSFLTELTASVASTNTESPSVGTLEDLKLSAMEQEFVVDPRIHDPEMLFASAQALPPDLAFSPKDTPTIVFDAPGTAAEPMAVAAAQALGPEFVTPTAAELNQPYAPARRQEFGISAAPGPLRSGKHPWLLPVAIWILLLASAGTYFGFYRRSPVLSSGSVSLKPSPAPRPTPTAQTAPAVAIEQPSAAALSRTEQRSQLNHGVIPAPRQVAGETEPAELEVIQGQRTRSPLPAETAPPEAPAIGVLATRDTGVLPSAMMATPSQPRLNAPQSEGVTGGKLLKRVLPRYPDEERDSGVSGDVVLTAVVGVDGKLHEIKAISGNPMLREQAIAAAKQWLYSPFLLGGKPVETHTRITMNFTR